MVDIGDVLADRREERFCEYMAVEGYECGGAWNRAFRDDCGLERESDSRAKKRGIELTERSDISGRIEQIKGVIRGSGAVTEELLIRIVESRLMKTAMDEGGSSKDKLNIARTLTAYTTELRKMRGWDKKKEDTGVTIRMERVFPEGYTPVKGESVRVDMDFSVERRNGAITAQEKGKSKKDVLPELATEAEIGEIPDEISGEEAEFLEELNGEC